MHDNRYTDDDEPRRPSGWPTCCHCEERTPHVYAVEGTHEGRAWRAQVCSTCYREHVWPGFAPQAKRDRFWLGLAVYRCAMPLARHRDFHREPRDGRRHQPVTKG